MRNRHLPSDGRPVGEAIHATAVAISGLALLILGPSGAGKSRLALALIGASTRSRPILLIGDDRILLARSEQGLVARPHPRIAGFIERRGLGIVASPFVAAAPVGGWVVLGSTEAGIKTPPISLAQNFPGLRCVNSREIVAETVLQWWRGACTTLASKPPRTASLGAKD